MVPVVDLTIKSAKKFFFFVGNATQVPPTMCYSNTAVQQQMRWYKRSCCVVHPPTHQPTHPRRAIAIQQYSSKCVGTNRVAVSHTGISIFERFPAIPGSERSVPGRAFPRSPLAESVIGARSFAGERAAVWVGRGATARPREAKWRSGVASVFWVCYNKIIRAKRVSN